MSANDSPMIKSGTDEQAKRQNVSKDGAGTTWTSLSKQRSERWAQVEATCPAQRRDFSISTWFPGVYSQRHAGQMA